MSVQIYRCPYCGRDDFASAKGLNQHQRQKQACFTKMKQKYNVDRGYVTAQETIETLPVYPIERQLNNQNILSCVSQINRNFRLHFPQATDHVQSQVAHLPRLNQNEEDYATAREYPSDNSINNGFNQTIDSEEEKE